MEDIAVLGEPIPLVRGDTWDWFVVMWADPDEATPYDLTDKSVEAQIRWANGTQTVTCDITDPELGKVTISLTKEETVSMPLGSLSQIFFDVIDGDDRQTWFTGIIDSKEGFLVI